MTAVSINNARHALVCTHYIGRKSTQYLMRCEILANMPGGRLKVRVFGRLFWKGYDHVSRIRYVDVRRVIPWTPDTAEAEAEKSRG
ncbi:hypothetical protein MNC86_22070 [Pantoea agglomerans]|uniref:hypothetical protein n=1 Tax=Enterobacter agglomerans TaxID=549 RepID=UPI001F4D4C1C|nr:hypothetical protein [Pantoea agglomerans]MCH9408664.1 hypothetical protein [Pantoea agglomerans]